MCSLVVSDHVVAMTVSVRLCYGLACSLHLQQAVSQEVRSDRAAAASDIDSFFVYRVAMTCSMLVKNHATCLASDTAAFTHPPHHLPPN